MDIEFELRGIRFRWNSDKAHRNIEKHGIAFEQAAQVFFDPFIRYVDASVGHEQRDGALGSDFDFRVLFVVHLIVEEDHIRLISARSADPKERALYED